MCEPTRLSMTKRLVSLLLVAATAGCSKVAIDDRYPSEIIPKLDYAKLTDQERVEYLYPKGNDPCRLKKYEEKFNINFSLSLRDFLPYHLGGRIPLEPDRLSDKDQLSIMKSKNCRDLQALDKMQATKECSSVNFYTLQYGDQKLETSLLNPDYGADYCHKLMAQDLASIFKKNFDVPASFIAHWTVENIKYWWDKEERALKHTLNGFKKRLNALYRERASLQRVFDLVKSGEDRVRLFTDLMGPLDDPSFLSNFDIRQYIFKDSFTQANILQSIDFKIAMQAPVNGGFTQDLEHIKDLNISAAILWNKMLACHSGNAEKARRSYFLGEWFCHKKSRQQGFDLWQQIGALIGATKNLITVGGLMPIEYLKIPNDPGEVMAVAYKMDGALQMVAAAKQSAVSRTGPVRARYDRVRSSLFRKLALFPTTHPLFVQMLFQAVISEIPIHNNWDQETFTKWLIQRDGNTPNMKRLLNANGFFNAIGIDRCRPLGLWPSANAAIVWAIHIRQWELTISNPILRDKHQMLDPQVVVETCHLKLLPNVYYTEKRAIAIAVRDIYKKYQSPRPMISKPNWREPAPKDGYIK